MVAMQRCDVLAGCSEETERLTRPFASGAMRRAHEHVRAWMAGAGLEVGMDNIGNLRGRYHAASGRGPTLLTGSHLDSVRDAGRYDGPLGVMVALAAVQRLHDAGRRLPFAIEVLAFADEEGLRYGSTYLGSRAFVGALGSDELAVKDASGITMADAIRGFGGDPERIADDRWRGGDLLGYVEVHIEQGPVLEELGLPVGVVSAIAGQDRFDLTFAGQAGHAGTVPMRGRRDALVGSSRFVSGVSDYASRKAGLVATVGRLNVEPGAANVIPGKVVLTLDVRHAEDAARQEARAQLLDLARIIAESGQVTVTIMKRSERAAVACSDRLTDLLSRAAGGSVVQLVSGAGHDAVYLSELTDVGMVFVRCKGGVSHHPAESVEAADVAVAIDVLHRFILDLAAPA